MMWVNLSAGKVAIVDDEDFKRVALFKWSYCPAGYAVRIVGGKYVYLHRLIVDAPADSIVDHINRDTLDCRRSNLRVGNKCLNSINRGPQSNNTSGHRGVNFNKRYGTWDARIKSDGRVRNLGRFKRIEDAVAARQAAEREYYEKASWDKSAAQVPEIIIGRHSFFKLGPSA